MAKRKDSRLTGLNPLAYVGIESETPQLFFSVDRAPTVNDYYYNIGTVWLDTSTGINGTIWMLLKKDNRIANWQEIGAISGQLEYITPDAGIVVAPDAVNNVNVVGGANVITTGTLNTLTIDIQAGDLADTYITDSGVANPSGGDLNVVGGSNIVTSAPGSSNIVEISLNPDTIADAYITDAGTASPLLGNLNVLGGLNVATSGAGNTITITSPTILNIVTDAGTINPVAGSIDIVGSGDISTSGAGNTITIASSLVPPTSISNFKAYMSANILNVTGDGTEYQIVFDSEFLDIGGDFDTATGIFTAPIKGIYCFIGNILLDDPAAGTRTAAETKINITGTYAQTNSQNNINPGPIVDNIRAYTFIATTTTLMDVGDTATLNVSVSGGAKNIYVNATGGVGDTRTWFGGFLLSPF